MAYHEHPDCIAICRQWLLAQRRTARAARTFRPIKHLIESWGGRYVSRDDVIEAARQLGIGGSYPRFRINDRLVLPDAARLVGIGEALTQMSYVDKLSWQVLPDGPHGPYARAETGRGLADEVAAALEGPDGGTPTKAEGN